MKKVALLGMLLLVVSASMASAAGLGLRWTNCAADGGLINKSFACTANTGSNVLAGTFTLGADLLQASGVEVIVDVAAAGTSLPAWWQFKNVGSCRQTALSIAAYNGASCPDWASGQASMNIAAYQLGFLGANSARFNIVNAVAQAALADLFAGEYGVFTLTISNAKTVGTGACAGCATPACIVFNSCNVTTSGNLHNTKLVGAANGTDGNYVTWQGGAGVSTTLGSGCPAATPTRNATWGSVKSLYR